MECVNFNCESFISTSPDNCDCKLDVTKCPDYVPPSGMTNFDYMTKEARVKEWEKGLKSRDPKSRYYDSGGIETLDIIKAKLTPEQYFGWLLGNVIKYSCRANFKNQKDRDLEKISFYSRELKSI